MEARDDQRLSVSAFNVVGQPLRAVDPIDLPDWDADDSSERRIVAGFRFSRPGATASVTEELFERAAVPTAIVDRLAVRSLLGPSGTLQHRLVVKFRAVGVQSLLIALPAESELWAVEVDGQPIRASRRSAQWCLDAVDVCWKQKVKRIRPSEQATAAEAFAVARRAYAKLLAESKVD